MASGDEAAEFTVTNSTNSKPATLNFRVPYWLAGPAVLSINGQEQSRTSKPSTYLNATRVWKEGDVVKLTLPAALRIEHAKDSTSLVSIFHGPVLLAGELGRDGIRREVGDKDMNLRVPRPPVPAIVSSSQDPKDWFDPDPATRQVFKLSAVGPASAIVFRPLYDLHHQRYSVYWPLEAPTQQSSKAN